MRFKDLENKTDKEQYEMILSCEMCETKKVLDNPQILDKRILLFIGNYDGFATKRLCARTIEYLASEDRWKVSDIVLYNMDNLDFETHFTRWQLENEFRAFCQAGGFIIDL